MSCEKNVPIHSTLASDPDFSDLVVEFVAGMPSRIREIKSYREKMDKLQLQRAIHQLRGACGGYGFSQLTEIATSIEESMKSGARMESIEPRLDEFLEMLSRITAVPE